MKALLALITMSNALEAVITRLRKKLGAQSIKTRRDFGYTMMEDLSPPHSFLGLIGTTPPVEPHDCAAKVFAVLFKAGRDPALAGDFVRFLAEEGWLAHWLTFAGDRWLPPMRKDTSKKPLADEG